MGDFSDPRDFTERDVHEILYDDYLCAGLPPFKGLEKLFDDLNSGRLNYKMRIWQMTDSEIRRIAHDLGKEQLNLLVERM